jgi:hypothetical protein
MDSCGFKVTQSQVGGETSRDYMERVCQAFITLIKKKMSEEAKRFGPSSYLERSLSYLSNNLHSEVQTLWHARIQGVSRL